MPESEEIQNLLDRVPEGRSSGKYLDQLTPASREVLDKFERWLKGEDNKSESTARAYKAYVAKAMVELTNDPDFELDTDVKSAINALRRFQSAGVITEMIEDDENVDDVPKSGDTE